MQHYTLLSNGHPVFKKLWDQGMPNSPWKGFDRTNYNKQGFKCLDKWETGAEYINDSNESKSFYWYDQDGDKLEITISPNQRFEVLYPSPANYGSLTIY